MTDNPLKIDPFYNQPKDDDVLYRYITIDKLLDFLFSGRIPLARLNTFEDKLEGVTPQHLLLNFASDKVRDEIADFAGGLLKLIGENFSVNPTKRNSLRDQRRIFQNTNFASCWYVSGHESVAMWQLYSNPDSVAIRIPYKQLVGELTNYSFSLPPQSYEKLRYGLIDYHRFNDLDELSTIVTKKDIQGFMKDSSFQHEKEFRIMLQTVNNEVKKVEKKPLVLDEQIEKLNDKLDTKLISLTLSNFNKLPFEIIFHPQSSRWHRENIIKIIDKFQLPFKTTESMLKNMFN